jgi:NADH:ubiquinone oxidoreductase subunit 3 (subunit A)
MALTGLISSPVAVFVMSVLVAAIIYSLGGVLAPKSSPSEDKVASYACGEKVAPGRVPVTIHLFNYAALFIVFDVVAMILAFSLAAAGSIVMWLTLVYVIPVAVALMLLVRRR